MADLKSRQKLWGDLKGFASAVNALGLHREEDAFTLSRSLASPLMVISEMHRHNSTSAFSSDQQHDTFVRRPSARQQSALNSRHCKRRPPLDLSDEKHLMVL